MSLTTSCSVVVCVTPNAVAVGAYQHLVAFLYGQQIVSQCLLIAHAVRSCKSPNFIPGLNSVPGYNRGDGVMPLCGLHASI